MDTKLNLSIGLDSEWLAYQDGDIQAYTILIATPVDYDEECGMLTMISETGHRFYLSEGTIEMFWVEGSGFSLFHNSTSTMRPLKGKSNKDIM